MAIIMSLDLAVKERAYGPSLKARDKAPFRALEALNLEIKTPIISTEFPYQADSVTKINGFRNLPLEIRTLIWQFLPEPRRITAHAFPCMVGRYNVYSADDVPEGFKEVYEEQPELQFKFTGASFPDGMAVCREAYQAICLLYKPLIDSADGTRLLYFNPAIDFIHVDRIITTIFDMPLEAYQGLDGCPAGYFKMKNLQTLSFNLREYNNLHDWATESIRFLPNLHRLMLHDIVTVYDTNQPYAIRVIFNLVKGNNGSSTFVPSIKINLFVSRVLEYAKLPNGRCIITDRHLPIHERKSITHLWNKLNQDNFTVKTFPSQVVFERRYVISNGRVRTIKESLIPVATTTPRHRVNTRGSRFMYENLKQRFRQEVHEIKCTLNIMALDSRLLPGVASELRTIRSSASTPSLRSRDGSVTPVSTMGSPGGNVKVVVRVRAFLPRETNRNAECLIEMNPISQATTLLAPSESELANVRSKTRRAVEAKSFTFDNSFWSHDTDDAHYAHQEDVYNSLGEEFLDHNFEGYHTCIFAYGQTGSGKSYTMMGTQEQPGLIPRTCEDLFQRIESAQNETPNISYNVRVSYFEVYNEHVRDLLVPVNPNQPPYYLKIRESPTEGPYIKDLTDAPVKNISEIMRYMKLGDASRTTASTKMNDTSSRSHAVFTIMLKQIHHDMETDETTERMARIRLVDLAGSERAKATEATGARLREGGNINKSLTTLGRVIAALADPKHRSGKRSRDIVPYRDSILTWLLKDSLGGNSKTAMIACIAPSDYDETLSTLRYADQAKRIRTRAKVNQDHVSAAERDAQIAQMAEEIRVLQLSVSDSHRREKEGKEQEEKLEEYQNRVVTMQRMMEEKSMVSEGKIRSLQTENDALRLHLKLALDSLKNPIEVPQQPKKTVEVREVPDKLHGFDSKMEADKENHDVVEDEEDEYSVEDEGVDVGDHDEKASEMQGYMKDLLKDLGMFRRKIDDDKSRFVSPLGIRVNF